MADQGQFAASWRQISGNFGNLCTFLLRMVAAAAREPAMRKSFDLFGGFRKDRRAGVAPMLAIAALPIMGAVGAAVDFSRINAARTSFHAAIDSTALMLAKEARDLSGAELAQKTDAYFNALFVQPQAYNVQLTPQLTSPEQGTFLLHIAGNATMDTTFARMLGYSQVTFSASSTVTWGIRKLNLALALDNTGSMAASGKMTALKTASHNLLSTLKKAATTPGDILVSIVPFATDVNVGTSNVNADWIDWTQWEINNGTCSNTNYTTKTSCVAQGKVWTPKSHSTWNGCVNDRDQNNDALNTAPVAAATSTMFPAHQVSGCPTAMMPLTSDWAALNVKIDAMTPTGNTNTTIGLAWAWQTLTPSAPMNAPATAPDLDRVIVMLTDGTNTQNRWTGSQTAIDARMQKACDNVKAANIKLYTVRVIDGNADLLRNCASDPSMFYDIGDASELNNVFSSIAQKLANVRIAK
jgi:Flp pilus assembly protein TadG